MGICGSFDANDNPNTAQTKTKRKNEHNLLLLGTGNSGKSTFLKQLSSIYNGAFHEEDLGLGPRYIHDATILQMRHLLTALKEKQQLTLQPESLRSAENMEKLPIDATLSPEIAEDIKILWADPAIKETHRTRATLAINDSAPYFFEQVDRISAQDYVPTSEDFTKARIPTTGIRTITYTIDSQVFTVIDVGGQRSERRKWIDCFDRVHGVLFVVALSDYDQMLFEENTKNALIEALELFGQVVNSRYFRKTTTIVFLNKKDLFKEKIGIKSPLTVCFPNYTGNNEYQDAIDYIIDQFKNENRTIKNLPIYFHVTCATDKNNVKHVFDDIQHGLIAKGLTSSGLM